MADTTGIVFLDFETHSKLSLPKVGPINYAAECDAIVLAFAIEDQPVRVFELKGRRLTWQDAPKDLIHAIEQGMQICAWNTGFDGAVWCVAFDGPDIVIEDALDARVLAAAANLPADLEGAAQRLLHVGKHPRGKELIGKFSVEGADPREHPDDWRVFLDYAATDVVRMRDIWRSLYQLRPEEWEEYRASERINRRGVPVDIGFARLASQLAAQDRIDSGARLKDLTGGQVGAVTAVPKMKAWLYDNLDAEGRAIIARVIESDDEEEEDSVKLKLRRRHIMMLLAYLDSKSALSDAETVAYEMLEIRLFGGGASQGKFQAIVDQTHNGRLAMTYRFNGATQTGRFSSVRPQIHNMTRDPVAKTMSGEAAVIDALIEGRRDFTDGLPMARRLALLVRPTLVAPAGMTFVWGDWSSIESRVIAFLAGNVASAEAKLAAYRLTDADPTLPDMYKQIAARMFHVDPRAIDDEDPLRQSGKIAELACGFAGGIGALQGMAAGYGKHFTDEEAQALVDKWRASNDWAPPFWNGLWGAAMASLDTPRTPFQIGRLRFYSQRNYLGERTLFMLLPSGRRLIYPDVRITQEKDYDADGEVIGYSDKLTFRRNRGRVKMWKGLLAENATQGCAADILRGTLVRLESDPDKLGETVLHTHDEIMLTCMEKDGAIVARYLSEVMMRGFKWSEGLPLNAKATVNFWYTKAKKG